MSALSRKIPVRFDIDFCQGCSFNDDYTIAITTSNADLFASITYVKHNQSQAQASGSGGNANGNGNMLIVTMIPAQWAYGNATVTVSASTGHNLGGNTSFAVAFERETCTRPVPFLGFEVLPIAFASTVVGLSVWVQAFTFLSLSAFGDYGNHRKNILLITASVGILSSGAIILCSSPASYWVCGLLTVISNTAFGSSVVVYNAFLPYLVKADPTFRKVLDTPNISATQLLSEYNAAQDRIRY